MNIAQLRNVLKTAEVHYRSDGNREVADALSAFSANLLQGDGSKTVAAFVSRVEKARRPIVSRSAGKSRRKR
jgi:hypothetical protein